MPQIKLSIIIPCFNQGKYIQEALNSLIGLDEDIIEIIIINDGSTDEETNLILSTLKSTGYNVEFQENKGLGEARNAGIRLAQGEYILPLDADNKIFTRYIEIGINILNADKDVAVVYGNAEYFGDRTGILKPGEFNLQRIMFGNYIDACAIIRKSVIEEVGYYDNMKIMGLEDWDLWLRIGFKGYRFKYIDETLFYYRVTANSMMKALNENIKKQNEIEYYFSEKYKDKLDFSFIEDMIIYRIKRKPINFFYRTILKKYFPRRFEKLISENKMYRGHIYGRI
jgi:glycosyltransferase involved in cell wall biosynthesis